MYTPALKKNYSSTDLANIHPELNLLGCIIVKQHAQFVSKYETVNEIVLWYFLVFVVDIYLCYRCQKVYWRSTMRLSIHSCLKINGCLAKSPLKLVAIEINVNICNQFFLAATLRVDDRILLQRGRSHKHIRCNSPWIKQYIILHICRCLAFWTICCYLQTDVAQMMHDYFTDTRPIIRVQVNQLQTIWLNGS